MGSIILPIVFEYAKTICINISVFCHLLNNAAQLVSDRELSK